ncbi:hypothetical protein [Vulcanisaeta thermophila]|uniref:hypothetical protein n=1 Tax=Vulcanisaeta thermophila TaxID=867917 RepID=UPI001EE23500|nr:hypothetical protein [Vulcanisaeta thermophila]
MLKSFGVSVTTYEEAMRKLIESARFKDSAEVLEEALRLNMEMVRRLAETVKFVEEVQSRLVEELLNEIRKGRSP